MTSLTTKAANGLAPLADGPLRAMSPFNANRKNIPCPFSPGSSSV